MAEHIIVLGSNGDLGKRIVKALVKDGARVTALLRPGSAAEKSDAALALGAEPVAVDLSDIDAIARACSGAACIVSAIAGQREAMIDAQGAVLRGAVRARVPRFIPSDFSVDYRPLPVGENLTFEMRREFHLLLSQAPIASTAIFCGCFSAVLARNTPLLNRVERTVGYWGNANHPIDITTMDDTAAFTSAAALDSSAPETLHIASFRVSAYDLASFTGQVLTHPFELVNMGSLEKLREDNRRMGAAEPDKASALYANWRKGQYIESLFSTNHPKLDNTRYATVSWTGIADAVHLG